jgi:carbonic anhydrase
MSMLSKCLRTSLLSNVCGGSFLLSSRSVALKLSANSQQQQILKRTLTAFDSSFSSDDISRASPHVRNLLENNRAWVKETNEKDPEFFSRLAKGQKPRYLYFGCSDSRVPANQILGLDAGEVFVHRNIGNLVPGNDLNALSVLEFAVGHLGVTDIIVTGHYECGAIKAATSRQDLGTLENWLRLIRDVYRLHKDYLDLIKNDDQLHRTLVELNVIEQCLNIYKTGIVQRRRDQNRRALLEQTGKSRKDIEDDVAPRIHGMVFNPGDGILRKLPVNFEQRVGSLDHIYGLYSNAKTEK